MGRHVHRTYHHLSTAAGRPEQGAYHRPEAAIANEACLVHPHLAAQAGSTGIEQVNQDMESPRKTEIPGILRPMTRLSWSGRLSARRCALRLRV